VTVYGYSRVSTSEQADRHGLDAQRATIEAEAARRGWDVRYVVDAGWSGSTLDRPGVTGLLAQIRRGDVLVVARLDRLSRSLVDFAGLMADATRRGWAFVALDLGVDTTTPVGRLVANVMASVGQWEREVIGERTRDGMAAAKVKGRLPGRRSALPAEVQARLLGLRADGLTLTVLADRLNAAGVPTASGGRWSTSAVPSSTRSAALERAARGSQDPLGETADVG